MGNLLRLKPKDGGGWVVVPRSGLWQKLKVENVKVSQSSLVSDPLFQGSVADPFGA